MKTDSGLSILDVIQLELRFVNCRNMSAEYGPNYIRVSSDNYSAVITVGTRAATIQFLDSAGDMKGLFTEPLHFGMDIGLLAEKLLAKTVQYVCPEVRHAV